MAKGTGSASFDKAVKAVAAGKGDQGVFWLKTWIKEDPRNKDQLRAVAAEAVATRNWSPAAIMLRALTHFDPSSENMVDLARAALHSGSTAEAAQVSKQLLESSAAPPLVRAEASVVCAEAGDGVTALTAFRTLAAEGAVFPLYALNLSDALWTIDPALADETIAAALALLQRPGDGSPDVWSRALRLQEWQDRHRKGLSVVNAESAADVAFTTARPAARALLVQMGPLGQTPDDDARTWIFAMAAEDISAADPALRSASKTATGRATEPSIHLAPSFMSGAETWDAAPLWATLAPMKELRPGTPGADTFLLPCDTKYFEVFCLPLMRSMAATSPGTAVHVHLFADSTQEAERAAALAAETKLNLRITAEFSGQGRYFDGGGDRRNYYHAARFIRFHQFLEQSAGTLWMMDVDALLNRDIAGAIAALGTAEIGLRARPGRIEPWNRFSACLIAARNTAGGKTYARMTAFYLAQIMERGELRWGADQAALYIAYRVFGSSPPPTAFWSEAVTGSGEDSVFWFVGGGTKQLHLANTGPPTSPYEAAFRKYSRR